MNVPADVSEDDDAGSGHEGGCGSEGAADDDDDDGMAGDASSHEGAVQSDGESAGFWWVVKHEHGEQRTCLEE